MRLDQWLWAVRVYKTRTRAAEAVKGGHVKVGGEGTKPSHEVRMGELITAHVGALNRTLRVIGEPAARVAGKLVAQFAEDLTPAEEYERVREAARPASGHRERGLGRPTKRDRRQIEAWESDSE